jgi:DNA-binding response OmpR family regulator
LRKPFKRDELIARVNELLTVGRMAALGSASSLRART